MPELKGRESTPESWQDAGRGWAQSIRHVLDRFEGAGDVEEALAHAATVQRYVDRLTAEVVRAARRERPAVSWARIGVALGVSRQAANERFSPAGQQGAMDRRYRRAKRNAAQPQQTPPGAAGGADSHP